jgi:4a-hydroxytetrahydrobiopterin dehydratase
VPAPPLPSTPAELAALVCTHRTERLPREELDRLAALVPDWEAGDGVLSRSFAFADFHRTMAFVNAVAWIAHRQDHHPDLTVSYSRCRVAFSTHSAGGLTLNDFVCAAHIDLLRA